MLLNIAAAEQAEYLYEVGLDVEHEDKVDDPTTMNMSPEAARKCFSAYNEQALSLVPVDDPKWLAVVFQVLFCLALPHTRQTAASRAGTAKNASHQRCKEFVERWTPRAWIISRKSMTMYSKPWSVCHCHVMTYVLLVYG